MMNRAHSQGMALLMALVMLAIASSLAVAIWYSNQLSLARISNLQKSYQAKHYSQGMLLWASDILREDYAQDDNQHDSSLDAWQQGIQGMLVEDAVLSGTLVGLNNRFNVNNLIINGVVSEPHLSYFRRLLLGLELDVTLADKVLDWIDADQVPEPNGAEDFVYLSKSPGYKTTGGYFKHIQELSLLDGLSAGDFARLSPYISALPVQSVATRMNVNTLPPVMLSALDIQITNEMAVRLYQEGRADFLKLEDFFQHEAIRYLPARDVVQTEIRKLASTQTLFLQASSLVQMEDSSLVMYALLARSNTGNARVISRSSSPYLPSTLVK
jgi:general secretion pathway protein K